MRTPLESPARRRRLLAGGCAALLLTAAGCGGGDKSTSSPPAVPTAGPAVSAEQVFADLRAAAAAAPSTAAVLAPGLATAGELEGQASSAAAELRAGLNAAFVEHVHLTGLAALFGYRFGPQSAPAAASLAALQANASAVADLIGRAEAGQRQEFAIAWGERVAAELAYAAAADDGDAGAGTRGQASAALLSNAKALGRILSEATDGVLSTASVQKEFVLAATRITAVLDALGTGSVEAAKRMRTADDHAGDLAATLAAGLDRAAELDGDPNQAAAGLRADVAGLLTESVYLTALSEFSAYTSPDGAAAPAAVAALDASDATAQSLATVLGAAIGRERQAEFLALWRQYVDDLHAYATGADKPRTAAGARLAGFPGSAGSFLAGASKDALPAADVTAALAPAAQAMIKALDSLRSLRDVPAAAPSTPASPDPVSPDPNATPGPTESASPSPSASATP